MVLGRLLWERKTYTKMDVIRFFRVFYSYWNENVVQIRIAKSVWAFRNKMTNGFRAQIRLHQRYKTANEFHTRCNYYYIWPIMTLLELKYIITSARNAAAIAKGMVEVRSIVVYWREERERWRQGPRCLRCAKLRRIGGLGCLTMAPRRSSGCDACIPDWLHAGTVDGCYAQAAEPKHPHFEGGIDVSPAVPYSIRLFVGSSPCWQHSRSGIIICNNK